MRNGLNILIAVLIFGFLIFIHELGHYLTARLFKVGINEFAIGMGPKLLSKTSKKTGIAYSLRLLPIGGFVSMVGEDEENDREDSLNRKPIWQRFLVMAAGSVMNLLCGLVLMGVLVGMLHSSLGGTTVAQTVEGSPLQVGDKIVSIAGDKVYTSYDLNYVVFRLGSETADVTVRRDGQTLTLADVPLLVSTEEGTSYAFKVAREDFTFGTFVKHTYHRSVTMVRMIWESLFDLITGKYGIEQMSGPVGITKEIGNAASQGDGGKSLVNLTALIALNLGVMNLLPLPALDGGRILLLLIEGIRRKPLKREVEGYIHLVGMLLLLLLMLLITFQDVTRLIG